MNYCGICGRDNDDLDIELKQSVSSKGRTHSRCVDEEDCAEYCESGYEDPDATENNYVQ